MGIVVHDFGKQPLLQGRAKLLAENPHGGRWRYDDEMFEFATLFGVF